MLTPPIAQDIARDTGRAIGFNVLITDPDGMVLGSGDMGRVGSFHEASVEVMRDLRPAAHSTAEANRLTGVLPGVTLPILFDSSPVGTVGITGSPVRVRKFGPVVRSQTELLLRESLLLRSDLLHDRAVEKVIRDVAHFDPEIVDPRFIAFKAQELGYELGLRRAAVVVDVTTPPTTRPEGGDAAVSGTAALRCAILRTIRRSFSSAQDIVGEAVPGRYAVLHQAPARSDDDIATATLALARQMAVDLDRRHGIHCRAGVGSVASSVPELHDSYRDASNSLYHVAPRGSASSVVHVRDVMIHELLTTVSRRARTRFTDSVTASLRDRPDWEMLRQTIVTSFECGFNLVRASGALHIHRNTLVYRLHKIEAICGRSMTDPQFRLMLYLACLIDELNTGAVADRTGAVSFVP